MKRHVKDTYVGCLDAAEKLLGVDTRSTSWRQFRYRVLNLGNDKIRQVDVELQDYTIEFRPAIFSVEYKVDVPDGKLVEFEFGFVDDEPYFTMLSKAEEPGKAVSEALSIGYFVRNPGNGLWVFGVKGMYDLFHKVIPFFDKNECFKGKTLERYNTWKEKVYNMEKANA